MLVVSVMKDRARWQREVEVLREMAAVARQGWLIPQPSRTLKQHGDARHLVVFVHGIFASSGVFRPMAFALASEGLAPRQVHFDYTPVGSIDRHARRLTSVIEEARVPGPVTIVAHSLGGLIARHAMQHLGLRVDALVTMGTPHRGTAAASPWPWRLARELSPDSVAIASLGATSHRLQRTAVTSVVAGQDMLVDAESATLPGSRLVVIPGVGHHGVLYAAPAWDAVRDAIRLVTGETAAEEARAQVESGSADEGRSSGEFILGSNGVAVRDRAG
jgi:predicted alpha/beta hydrolase family esterase